MAFEELKWKRRYPEQAKLLELTQYFYGSWIPDMKELISDEMKEVLPGVESRDNYEIAGALGTYIMIDYQRMKQQGLARDKVRAEITKKYNLTPDHQLQVFSILGLLSEDEIRKRNVFAVFP